MAALLVVGVLVFAVFMLGSAPETSKFASVATAIDPGPGRADADWATWTATDGSFTLDFPSTPTPQPPAAAIPNMTAVDLVMDDHGTYAYAASVVEAHEGFAFADPQTALDIAVDSMAASANITLSSRESGSFGLLPSQSFAGTADLGSTSGAVQGLAFVSENRMWVLFTIAGDPADVDFARFTDSFTLR